MIKAVIFDMDGVLIDSEPLFDRHMSLYLPTLGITTTPNYLEQFRGANIMYQWTKIKKDFHLRQPLKKLMQDGRNSYYQFLLTTKLKPIPGIKPLIKRLQKHNYKIALASSASLRRINLFLEKLSLKNTFSVVICGDDVKRSKPAPDIYLKVAKNLYIKPQECLVIEDATNGIQAAKAAKMQVVGYTGSNHDSQNLSKADIIIQSMNEITISLLKTL